jgi:hypothetical protein
MEFDHTQRLDNLQHLETLRPSLTLPPRHFLLNLVEQGDDIAKATI